MSAAGEYIAAEKLEVDFGTCDLVEQIWVYGNSYEVSFCPPCKPTPPPPLAPSAPSLRALAAHAVCIAGGSVLTL